MIHFLRRLVEKYKERNRDIQMVLIDLENTYENVPREVIWRTLVARWVPNTYIYKPFVICIVGLRLVFWTLAML